MDYSNVLPRTDTFGATNDQENRITQIVNTLAIIAAILAFSLGCLFYSLTGYQQVFYPAMLEAMLFLSVLLVTRYASVESGKRTLFSLHTLFICYFGIVLGPESQIYLFAPFLAFCVLLIYSRWLTRISILTICAGLIVFVQLNYKLQVIATLPSTANFQQSLHWIAVCTATFLNGSVLYYYAKENRFRNQHLTMLIEQLNKTNQSMRIYVRETTHEIRSPLNVVNSVLQNYLETTNDSKKTIQVGKAHLEAVYFACQDIQLVMSNALGWSKIEAGKDEIDKSTFQVKEWLAQLCDTYEYLGKKRAVHISSSICDQLPEYILTDISKFRSIIVNLLSNAIKFTALHSVVRLCAGVINNRLIISVTDQGGGIPDHEKEHIFDPYVSAARQQNEATGLGLPIARHLARQMGGDLLVTDNSTRSGSTFTLQLPLEIALAPDNSCEECTDYEQLKGLKILVADDDSMNLLAFSLALERLGVSIILADSGYEALHKARQYKPDIFIIDMIMPKISGVEVISQLQHDNDLKHIPTILVSGNCYSEVQEEVVASGADGFLSKPVNFQALYQTLKDLVVYEDMQA